MSHESPVSVIVPCHHTAATVSRAVESIAAQTLAPAEVIIVDDASKDATVNTIEAMCSRNWPFALRTVRLTENVGPGGARNVGWAKVDAGARYVAFLDADDVWLPTKLEQQVVWMQDHEDVAWSAHRVGIVDGATVSESSRGIAAIPITRVSLLMRNAIATPTVVVRATVPERFRAEWRRCEDLMLWLDWLDGGYRGMMLDATLALLGRKPATPGGATGDLPTMYAGERRVIDTLESEHRLSLLAAMAWRGYAWARYQRRRASA